MAAQSSVLAWRIPWTEELVVYSPQGHKGWDMTEAMERAHTHTVMGCYGDKVS